MNKCKAADDNTEYHYENQKTHKKLGTLIAFGHKYFE